MWGGLGYDAQGGLADRRKRQVSHEKSSSSSVSGGRVAQERIESWGTKKKRREQVRRNLGSRSQKRKRGKAEVQPNKRNTGVRDSCCVKSLKEGNGKD